MTQPPKLDIEAIRAKLAAMKGAPTSEKIAVAQVELAEQRAAHPLVGQQVAVTVKTTDAKSIIDSMQLVKEKPDADKSNPTTEYLAELDVADLHTKIASLQTLIQTAHPTMPVLLREIHTTLKKQPDNVTLLDDAEIGVIVSGLLKHTNVVLSSKILKAKGSSKKSISIDDL